MSDGLEKRPQVPSSPPPTYAPPASPSPGQSGQPQPMPPMSPTGQQGPAMPQPTVYVAIPAYNGVQYQQQMLARCSRGDHDWTVKHGIGGILCAILLFPIGLLCLCIDVHKRCKHCGVEVPV